MAVECCEVVQLFLVFFSTLSRLPHLLARITNQTTPTVGAAAYVDFFTVRHTNKRHDVVFRTVLNRFTSEVSL